MKRRAVVVLVCMLVLVALFLGVCTHASEPRNASDLVWNDVLIASVVANAVGSTSDDEIPNETITLLNNTLDTVDLAGLTICDENTAWTIPYWLDDTLIKPGEYWSVSGSVYNQDLDCSEAICLRNSGEMLTLAFNGEAIDAIRYPPCSGSAYDGRVLDRSVFALLAATDSECQDQACFNIQASVEVPVFSLTAWGAAGEVQGSCYLLRYADDWILVDCGSFMNTEDLPVGPTEHRDEDFPFDPRDIDAVLITHAHDDHMGRLHLLIAAGFAGPIYMTDVTAEISTMKLQSAIAWWDCVDAATKRYVVEYLDDNIVRCGYGEEIEVASTMTASFLDAGHIPGSASIEMLLQGSSSTSTILFSGDLGSGNHPFLNPPDLDSISEISADLLIIESTYGGTIRSADTSKSKTDFLDAIERSVSEDRLVVVPTFALDRTQRVVAAIGEGIASRYGLAKLRVGIGGLSSCQFSQLYEMFQVNPKDYESYFSASFWDNTPLHPRFWTYIRDEDCLCRQCEEDSTENLETLKSRYDVIVTPSGFGSSSLSKKLINEFVDDSSVTFIKVGWAPSNSPMGRLATANSEDAERVALSTNGLLSPFRCGFQDISGFFSGHGDENALAEFALSFESVAQIYIGHGEPDSSAKLQSRLREELPSADVRLLQWGVSIDLRK